MRAPVKWALVLGALVLLIGQAGATVTYYDFTQVSAEDLGDPSEELGVGTTPDWWGVADDYTGSMTLASVPSNQSSGKVYYGVGVAPEWWVAPLPEEPEAGSGGWRWTKSGDDGVDYMTVWIKNRLDRAMVKEFVLWWTPTEEEPEILWKHVLLVADTGTGTVEIAPVETDWNEAEGSAFAKWIINPQPAWESVTFTSCSHPSCDIWVGFNCAPGLPAIALVGAVPAIGMFLRRRRS